MNSEKQDKAKSGGATEATTEPIMIHGSQPSPAPVLKIKFSNQYIKLPRALPFRAKLLHVFIIDRKDMGKDFLAFDTSYHSNGTIKQFGLGSGSQLVLLLIDEECNLFTTIRSNFPITKRDYYISNIGNIFECVKVIPHD
jgi:hypothetical protein